MKTNKEQIYTLLELRHREGQSEGASTQYIARTLGMQRTNVSALLADLVSEGRAIKRNGRPVLYYARTEPASARNCFLNLVGHDGSLKRAVQLAQAAVLYPQGSLNALIVGPRGSGKTFFALLMHRYAIENAALPASAPYRVVDCDADGADLYGALFGSNGAYDAARRGMLVIDNAHLMAAAARNAVFERIDALESLEGPDGPKQGPLVVALYDSAHGAADALQRHLPVTLALPSLSERPLAERMSLIQNFITLEAARAKRVIALSAELMRCLLLYDADMNITRLKYDIKVGCANAYLREHAAASGALNLYFGDFDNAVRKGFLNYRARRDEVERIIPADYGYRFDADTVEMTAIDRDKLQGATLYSLIDHRVHELSERGLSERDVSLLLVAELEPQFRAYQKELTDRVLNAEHLARLVDARVIALVRSFLDEASARLRTVYAPAVFHGLCLHLDGTLKGPRAQRALAPRQIREIVETFHAEYALCLQLAARIEREFSISLGVDEVVMLTLFLCYRALPTDTADKPVALFALHGEGLARSLSAAVNRAVMLENVHAFEVPYDDDPQAVYEGLKRTLTQIDRGAGVIAFIDAEPMADLAAAIAVECGIEVRTVHLPLVGIGYEVSKRAAMERDIDALHEEILARIAKWAAPKPAVIVTLCGTGEGGAQELKDYIDRNGGAAGASVVALPDASRERLGERLRRIQENASIQCVVGARDPGLFGLPFLPASEVLGARGEELVAVLKAGRQRKKRQMSTVDFEAIYDYLAEHLERVSVPKLKAMLPVVLGEINQEIALLSFDAEIGLFLHLPCCIERLLAGGDIPACIQKAAILDKHYASYKKLIRILKPVERAFKVLFNDDELAILLMIIYQI